MNGPIFPLIDPRIVQYSTLLCVTDLVPVLNVLELFLAVDRFIQEEFVVVLVFVVDLEVVDVDLDLDDRLI